MRLRQMLPFLALTTLSGSTFFKLVSSSKLKPPHFEYVRCDLVNVNDRSALLKLTITAQNPNEIGLKNVFVDYELFTVGKRFLEGSNVAFELRKMFRNQGKVYSGSITLLQTLRPPRRKRKLPFFSKSRYSRLGRMNPAIKAIRNLPA